MAWALLSPGAIQVAGFIYREGISRPGPLSATCICGRDSRGPSVLTAVALAVSSSEKGLGMNVPFTWGLTYEGRTNRNQGTLF